jgi:pimeloyl-ACP methyl ester carboxylesterase
VPRYAFRQLVLRPIVRRLAPGAMLAEAGRRFAVGDVVVTEWGAGPAILLVHAGGSTGAAWNGVAPVLAEGFRVLVYDRPTYRRKPPLRGAEAMAAEVADLLAVADAVEGPLLVVGHSSGAVVALQAALAAPARFAGLLLYEPPLAVDRPLGGEALGRARAALDRGDPHEAMVIHVRDIVGAGRFAVLAFRFLPVVGRALVEHAEGQVADDEALRSLGVGVERYAAVDVPVLLLAGERSPAHLRAALDALAAVLPRLDSVVVLPGQGHLATVRAPDRVADVIAGFAGRVLD